jgi:hypothetical protein
MPLVSTEATSEFWLPVASGPEMICDLSASAVGPFPPASVPTGGFQSGVIPSDGFKTFAVGITSSEPGALNVQRFLDAAGTIAQGTVSTAPLTAGQAAVLNITDGLISRSFTLQVTNTGGAAATVTKFALLLGF